MFDVVSSNNKEHRIYVELFQAGIPDKMLSLALEPETASLYCHKNLKNIRVKVGCRYMVLDLGGKSEYNV